MAKFIEFGAGKKPFRPDDPEWLHNDKRNGPHIEFPGDMGSVEDWSKWNIPIHTVDGIRAIQCLEHLDPGQPIWNFFELCWWALKKDGILLIEVPQFPDDSAIMHPDHRSLWVPNSFAVFVPPSDGIDVINWVKHFWHICKIESDEVNIHVEMTPNKPGMTRYEYKEVKL